MNLKISIFFLFITAISPSTPTVEDTPIIKKSSKAEYSSTLAAAVTKAKAERVKKEKAERERDVEGAAGAGAAGAAGGAKLLSSSSSDFEAGIVVVI